MSPGRMLEDEEPDQISRGFRYGAWQVVFSSINLARFLPKLTFIWKHTDGPRRWFRRLTKVWIFVRATLPGIVLPQINITFLERPPPSTLVSAVPSVPHFQPHGVPLPLLSPFSFLHASSGFSGCYRIYPYHSLRRESSVRAGPCLFCSEL